MNKQSFCWILESALLNFEGVQEAELIKNYNISPVFARIGVQLCSYLKSKEISHEIQK